MNIHVAETGIVYRNPSPNIWSRQAFFPSVLQAPSGDLLASFDMGIAMENADVRTYLCRSSDEGKTWSQPVRIHEPDCSQSPVSTLGRVSLLRDGTLLALQLLCDRSRNEFGLANPKTEGYVETQFCFLKSHDEGRTWSKPKLIMPPLAWNAFEICSPIISVSDSRWLLPTSLWRNWDGDCPFGMKAVSFLSDDQGETWHRTVDVMNLWEQQTVCWEQKQTELSDGRRMAVCWCYDYAKNSSLPNRYAFSTDHGESYGPALISPLAGETCTPYGLPDNHVLCIYRRVDERGLWAHLACIEGDTWVPLKDEPLWGTARSSYGLQSSSKVEEMAALRFGYPQLIRLPDGDFFVVFWCVEECVAQIRWIRLRLQ
ncbi:MAG: glycoside hydrolase [Candidatus Hydrogenedentes bacterium]|nr:glycoside hydrolase [Candidatus Hydrogenedentota bacterium]